MGITYEALFSSRGTKLGAPASSLRSEGAYEDRRPVPNPVSLLEEFGIERRQREAPALCDPLSVTVLSWATACFQGALPQCPSLAPGERGPPGSPGEASCSHSHHAIVHQGRATPGQKVCPCPICRCLCRALCIPSLTHPHRVLPRQPLCSADQRLSVRHSCPRRPCSVVSGDILWLSH